MAQSDILADVSLDAAWPLVERFSTFPRWKPADVNASAGMIVSALEAAGAKWSDDEIVQDRFLLTAKSNEDMSGLIDAMLRNFVAAVEQRKAAA
jgi:hypothetical protein